MEAPRIETTSPIPPSHPALLTRNPRLRSVDRALQNAVASLEREQELKKAIRDAVDPLDDIARRATSILNDLHSVSNIDYKAVAHKAVKTVDQSKELWEPINELIPPGQFHRYNYAISPTIRTLVQIVAYGWFMMYDRVAPSAVVTEVLGIPEETGDGVVLIADDYLQGVIGAINELPRLSVNAVTAGNYHLPIRISQFVNDVFSAYSQLNLRNDALRRKFDSLKYDVKKCEDVIYDLTLRGLIGRTPQFAGVVPLPGGPHSPARPGQPLSFAYQPSPGPMQAAVRPGSPGQVLGFQPYPSVLPHATPPRFVPGGPDPMGSNSPKRRLVDVLGPSPQRTPGLMLPAMHNISPLRNSDVTLPPIRSFGSEGVREGGPASVDPNTAAESSGPRDPEAMDEDKKEDVQESEPPAAGKDTSA